MVFIFYNQINCSSSISNSGYLQGNMFQAIVRCANNHHLCLSVSLIKEKFPTSDQVNKQPLKRRTLSPLGGHYSVLLALHCTKYIFLFM